MKIKEQEEEDEKEAIINPYRELLFKVNDLKTWFPIKKGAGGQRQRLRKCRGNC